ncbi:DNA recombination protein RmuC [Microbacterium sp. KUDC0406]|uniref:DNA recombination protein RmuC n=1 Tax=Microbacterium sp. KUDC0406 TaxID=2909588 RepID=UPI001F334889|nr:DNA recombination protein RmuC [Microbacterium sp. KUDC0406]UJP11594.1 DNA recombination protein RmuC [Microbacterium sp. KUDC0406]
MEVLLVVLCLLTLALLALVLFLLLALRARLASGGNGGDGLNAEVRSELAAQRRELVDTIAQGQNLLDQRIIHLAQTQASEGDRERTARRDDHRELQTDVTSALNMLVEQFRAHAQASTTAHSEFRADVDARVNALRLTTDDKLEKIRLTVDDRLQGTLKVALQENAEKIQALNEANTAKHTEMQTLLREELDKLRTGNEAKLEKMRETVDEKLQGTLEKRLGESFALVSERLEQVQKGLGEMHTLASDVGGLKRVLTNVKNRGSWGEVQLSRQLEDLLTPGQYAENVVIKPGSQESVEFAVKLPGREDDSPVYLPIDSKFPQEDYERLLEAQENGDKAEIETAIKRLEKAILAQAKLISSKYIAPPQSTDFAIMYLPTEGLFAEVARRPGLTSRLQNDLRVMVTGPTTLMSLLNSLQMGFRTLAIEKRSSEVWKVLAAAKNEFQKYGQVWDKLDKQLKTAQRTVQEAGVRTRAVERRLRDVEDFDAIAAPASMLDVLDATQADADEVTPYERGAELDGVVARLDES